MMSLEDKITSLLQANRYILFDKESCRRVAKEIMAEVYSSGFKQVIFPFEDTCGETLEKVTGRSALEERYKFRGDFLEEGRFEK